jgi:predicted phosphodiesterase
MSKTLIIPDLHAPFHDIKVWSCILSAIRGIKPETVVIIGDFIDCYSVSKFPKQPTRALSLDDEVTQTRAELKRLQRAGCDELIYCEGNHEFRLERYLCEKAPELYGLVTIKDLLFQGSQVKWVPYRQHIRRGKVLYAHDIGYAGVYAGRHTLAAAGTNIVFGHSHRAGTVFEGTHLGERRFSMNVGWAGDISAVDYMHKVRTKDWQHGFGMVTVDDRTGLVWPQFVPIIRGRACFDGKWYQA